MSRQYSFLYVEDDATSRTVMEILLMHWFPGAAITIFEDSLNFIKRVESISPAPNVIFLDIHLQPYNGFEMLRMLRQHPQFTETLIVALTASVMSEEISLLQSSGFDGVLAKPINREAFPKLINRMLDGEAIWYVN